MLAYPPTGFLVQLAVDTGRRHVRGTVHVSLGWAVPGGRFRFPAHGRGPGAFTPPVSCKRPWNVFTQTARAGGLAARSGRRPVATAPETARVHGCGPLGGAVWVKRPGFTAVGHLGVPFTDHVLLGITVITLVVRPCLHLTGNVCTGLFHIA